MLPFGLGPARNFTITLIVFSLLKVYWLDYGDIHMISRQDYIFTIEAKVPNALLVTGKTFQLVPDSKYKANQYLYGLR